MEKTPISSLMQTTLENIKDMVDVSTVVGDALEVNIGTSVIPISRVCFGFVAGGGEYEGADTKLKELNETQSLPFAGGTGAGVSVQPVGFLVVTKESVKMLPAQNTAAWERALSNLPQLIDDIRGLITGNGENKHKDMPQG